MPTKNIVSIVSATAIGVAILLGADPLPRFANATNWLADNSGARPGAVPSPATIHFTNDTPALIQSIADARVLSTAKPEPTPADTSADSSKTASDSLLLKFRAWAAEQDAQAHLLTVRPPEETPAKVLKKIAKNAREPHRLPEAHPNVLSVRNMRTDARHQDDLRKQDQRVQNAQREPSPTKDARAHDRAVQNDRTRSLLPTSIPRN